MKTPKTPRITLARVNEALTTLGKVELVRGTGYWYFVGDDVRFNVEGVYVANLSQLTIAEWIQEGRERLFTQEDKEALENEKRKLGILI